MKLDNEVTPDEIVEAREGIYGHPYDNFANIAGLWSIYLNGRFPQVQTEIGPIYPGKMLPNPPNVIQIEREDVAHMMILLKAARTIHGGKDPDTIVDIAGYARCIQLIREKENAQS